MKLTLKTLQTEMHDSFATISNRIDKLDKKVDYLDLNVNERIDNVFNTLVAHIKESNYQFRQIDKQFRQIDKKFEKVDGRFNEITMDIISGLKPYFNTIEKMLENHENRITNLEKAG